MLAQYMVDRVRKLLAEKKLSRRTVSKRTGASRGSIANIAGEIRRDGFSPPDEREQSDDSPIPLAPPEHCPTCGKLVYPPCRACKLKKHLQRHPEMTIRPQPYETLSEIRLELKPAERDRYEMVRAWRREDEEEAARIRAEVNSFPRSSVGTHCIRGSAS
jgi:hypothetical protein